VHSSWLNSQPIVAFLGTPCLLLDKVITYNTRIGLTITALLWRHYYAMQRDDDVINCLATPGRRYSDPPVKHRVDIFPKKLYGLGFTILTNIIVIIYYIWLWLSSGLTYENCREFHRRPWAGILLSSHRLPTFELLSQILLNLRLFSNAEWFDLDSMDTELAISRCVWIRHDMSSASSSPQRLKPSCPLTSAHLKQSPIIIRVKSLLRNIESGK